MKDVKPPLTLHPARLGPAESMVIRTARPPDRVVPPDGDRYPHAQAG
nr:hypothetical protein OG409_09695 [Streptomyces sp. NBC_00974]